MKSISRIVVTGENSDKSTIIHDGLATNISEHIPGLIIADVWATNTMPELIFKICCQEPREK